MKPVILDQLPQGLLDCPASELHRHLDGPTLIHLPGRRPQPLFVSVLQHGNEISGWDAVRRLLKGRYTRDPLPRSLVLLIANVRAASRGRRHLTDQPDFNRCWPGSDIEPGPWHELFADITRHVRALKPVASIDIHNNTGQNPHYGAVNYLDPASLRLATLFSRTVIHFTRPGGVQSMAFGAFCPAVTLECGPPWLLDGTDHALAYLESVLNLEKIPSELPSPENLELFRMVATASVRPDVTFAFEPDEAELSLRADLDRFNFSELPPGTRLGRVSRTATMPLTAVTHEGVDVSSHWFAVSGSDLVTTRPLMPAMLSTDEQVIRQDCLCHLMERIPATRRHIEAAQRRMELPETDP